MKSRLALLCYLLALSPLTSVVFAEAVAAPAPAQEDTTELGEKMSAMSKAFKKLRSQVADPTKNEDSLKLVAAIRENAEAAMKHVPEKTADVPAADQAKFKADYIAGMKSLVGNIAKVEAALIASNNEEAKSLLEALGNAQKEGHKEFRKKKPEKK